MRRMPGEMTRFGINLITLTLNIRQLLVLYPSRQGRPQPRMARNGHPLLPALDFLKIMRAVLKTREHHLRFPVPLLL